MSLEQIADDANVAYTLAKDVATNNDNLPKFFAMTPKAQEEAILKLEYEQKEAREAVHEHYLHSHENEGCAPGCLGLVTMSIGAGVCTTAILTLEPNLGYLADSLMAFGSGLICAYFCTSIPKKPSTLENKAHDLETSYNMIKGAHLTRKDQNPPVSELKQ